MRADFQTSTIPGAGNPRAAAHRDRHSDFSCMQVSITQLILRISPPAEYEFRIPVFHIHVPRYCAYGKLRAAGDSETLDLTLPLLVQIPESGQNRSIFDLLCIIMHAAAGGGGDRDLRGAGDDAPPSAQSGG